MAIDLKTVYVRPESDIDRLLAQVEDRVFVLERNSVRYIITRLDAPEESLADGPEEPSRMRVVGGTDIWAGYDPERLRTTLRETAGSWGDIDAEELKAHIYRSREEGSKPPIS